MTDDYDGEEDELQHQQGGRLYPIGRSLRSTFPPADGEDLQPRITTLMVELAHQPYEDLPPFATQVHHQHGSSAGHRRSPSIFGQLGRLFRRDH